MKTLVQILILFYGLNLAALAMAHSGHHHHHHQPKKQVSETTAKENAAANISELIKQKKIDASWAQAKFVGIEKKRFGKRLEWVAVYNNKAIEDVDKQKLYVFLKLSGEYVAANYTGK